MFDFKDAHEYQIALDTITATVRGQYNFKGVAIYNSDTGSKVRRVRITFNPFNKKLYICKYSNVKDKIDRKHPKLNEVQQLSIELLQEHTNRPIKNDTFSRMLHKFIELELKEEVAAIQADAAPVEIVNEIMQAFHMLVECKAPIHYSTTKSPKPYLSDSGVGQFWLQDLGEAKKGVHYK